MTNNKIEREPRFVQDYIPGINDLSKRPRHRGILRTFQWLYGTPGEFNIKKVSKFMEWLKDDIGNDAPPTTGPATGELQSDGYFYFYSDEFLAECPSIREAAVLLGRNRSTLNTYAKNRTFPATKIEETGAWGVDIIAAQDWILWNTEHHDGLEPYWPKQDKPNVLITLSIEQAHEPEPLFQLHGPDALELAELGRAA